MEIMYLLVPLSVVIGSWGLFTGNLRRKRRHPCRSPGENGSTVSSRQIPSRNWTDAAEG